MYTIAYMYLPIMVYMHLVIKILIYLNLNILHIYVIDDFYFIIHITSNVVFTNNKRYIVCLLPYMYSLYIYIYILYIYIYIYI